RRRADPDPGRRAARGRQGPAFVRDQRGVRAVGGAAPADGLPARGAGRGRRPAGGGVHGRAVPGHRGGGRVDPAVRPREPAGQELPGVQILVCVKRVPMVGGKIVILPNGQELDTRMSGFTVSPHEECAVEEAVRLTERYGGGVTVLTLGPAEAADQLRDMLALGASRAVLLETDGREWGPIATAHAIVAAVRAPAGQESAARRA